MLQAFASCLEQLAFVGDDGDTQKLRYIYILMVNVCAQFQLQQKNSFLPSVNNVKVHVSDMFMENCMPRDTYYY